MSTKKASPRSAVMTPDEMREARQLLGMSQREFARELNVKQSSVFAWECDRIPIDLRTSFAVKFLILASQPNEAARIKAELQARVGIVSGEKVGE